MNPISLSLLATCALLSALFPEHSDFLLHTEVGARAGDRLGTALDGAGDVDGDGVDDWILGAPRARVAGLPVGRAFVLSGADHSVLHSWLGGPGSTTLGACVAGAGDVDLDGLADLLVGVPYGAEGHGELRLYSGADGSLLRSWSGTAPGDQFGRAAAGIGDVNGDGTPDIAVGAPQSDAGGQNGGQLRVFSGLDGTELFSVAGGTFDQLGFSVVGLGDLNMDGRPDFAVGIPFSDVAAFNGGAVRAYSGLDGALLFEVAGQGVGDQFGFGLDAGHDATGDGWADLVVAAPGADANGIDSGAGYLVSGANGEVVASFPGLGPSTYLTAVGLLRDVDGDGLAEILTGCAGAGSNEAGLVQLYSGGDGALLESFQGPRARGWFGAAVAAGGDTNGDGLAEFVVGAPGHDDYPGLFGFVEVLSPRPLP